MGGVEDRGVWLKSVTAPKESVELSARDEVLHKVDAPRVLGEGPGPNEEGVVEGEENRLLVQDMLDLGLVDQALLAHDLHSVVAATWAAGELHASPSA